MPRRALIERRPWLLASIAAALAWYFLRNSAVPGVYLIALKGMPVALLAVYALLRHTGHDSLMVALVMALSALGDITIELDLALGGAAFFLSHLAAIALYLRHRRDWISGSQKALAGIVLVCVPLIAWQLAQASGKGVPAAAYAFGLAAMAAAAWTSNFPRYRVGFGAMLFVSSDLLIFAGLGPLEGSTVRDVLVWPLYYTGQFLIATGVIGELRNRGDTSA